MSEKKETRTVTIYEPMRHPTFKELRPGDLFTLKDEGEDPKEDGTVLNLALSDPFEMEGTYGIKCAPVGVLERERKDDNLDLSEIPDKYRNAVMILRHVRDQFGVPLEHLCALIHGAEKKED